MSDYGFKIFTCNCRCIWATPGELEARMNFLYEFICLYKPSIAIITETHLGLSSDATFGRYIANTNGSYRRVNKHLYGGI